MIINNFDDIKNKKFQVIILGSGPASISLAIKLENKKINCLIIEAGKEKYNQESQKFYENVIIGDNITDLKHSRLRQFGGTSGHWGGWCIPMEKYIVKSWGLDFDELNNYSNEACDILNIKNEFKKSKLNPNINQIQFQYSQVRFAKKFKILIEKSKYINLINNAHATHLIAENNYVDYVNVKFENKDYKIKSKIYILGCGGIENPRLLMWTRKLNKNFLSEKLPIGKYYMTHPWIIGGKGIIKRSKLQNLTQDRFIDTKGVLQFATSQDITKEKNILSGSFYMNANEDAKIYKEIIKDILCMSPEYGKKIARKVFKKDLKCGNLFMQLEEKGNEVNKITLDENIKDDHGVPITKLYYKKNKETIYSAKIILEELAKFLINNDIGRLAISNDIKDLKSYENLGVYHHMGTTRIGNDPKTSVVNTNLKVHGTKNLYVAGSSVFRSSGYSNPTYTIVQLSIRLANEISKKLNS